MKMRKLEKDFPIDFYKKLPYNKSLAENCAGIPDNLL